MGVTPVGHLANHISCDSCSPFGGCVPSSWQSCLDVKTTRCYVRWNYSCPPYKWKIQCSCDMTHLEMTSIIDVRNTEENNNYLIFLWEITLLKHDYCAFKTGCIKGLTHHRQLIIVIWYSPFSCAGFLPTSSYVELLLRTWPCIEILRWWLSPFLLSPFTTIAISIANKINAIQKIDTQVINDNHMAPAIMLYHDSQIMNYII